jgi:hypothetical protein
VETLLRKYLWAVDGWSSRCARCSWRARRRPSIGGRCWSAGGPRQAAARVARAATAAPVYTKQVEEILQAEHLLLDLSAHPGRKPRADRAAAPPPLQRTSLNLKLLAIMFAPPPADPRWSVAIIRDNDAKSAGPYNVGSKLRDATIDDIVEDRVYLDFGGGKREYLDLLDRPQPAAGAPAPHARASTDSAVRRAGQGHQEDRRAQLRGPALDAGFVAGQHGRAREGRAHRARDQGRQAGRLSSCSASGPTVRSRRSAC